MKIEIYTLSYCPFCVRAKRLLDDKGVSYEEHVMDTLPTELREAKSRFSHDTVPLVVIDGQFIGGSDELAEWDAAGKLS